MTEGTKREVIRLSLLGDQSVGKTTLRNVFLKLDFEENTLSTVGSNKSETKFKLKDGKEIKLFIYDTAGEERFRSLSTKAVKSCQGVVVVFDITQKESFEHLTSWLEAIKEESDKLSIVIFGNKCDLEDQRQVTKQEAEKFAKQQKIPYIETSAKLSTNINEGFSILVNDAYERFGSALGIKLKKKEKKKGKIC